MVSATGDCDLSGGGHTGPVEGHGCGVLSVQSSDEVSQKQQSNLLCARLLMEVADAVAWAGHTLRQLLPS